MARHKVIGCCSGKYIMQIGNYVTNCGSLDETK